MLKNGVTFDDTTIVLMHNCISYMQLASPPPKQMATLSMEDFEYFITIVNANKPDISSEESFFNIGMF